MSDPETLAVYAKSADEYAMRIASQTNVDEQNDFKAFVDALPEGARVLDLGCGPGHWAAQMKQAGLNVEAVDASAEMAALAKSQFDVDVRVETFDQLTLTGRYDAIWANFSLLHAPRDMFPTYLTRLRDAMTPDGLLHIGMKLGQGEVRDNLGRLYTYYEEDELNKLLETAGFRVIRTRCGSGVGLSGETAAYVIVTAHA